MKKQYYVTISMMPESKLAVVPYRKESRGELLSRKSRFPAIPVLEWSVIDEVPEIIAVMTDDDNANTAHNLELFKEELRELSEDLGVELKVNREIRLPHREDRKKQIELFRKICETFEEGSEIYMELTYGTKVTTVGLFSTLTFAEKVRHCKIKSIFYGKFPFGNATVGEIYDVRSLYELATLIHVADYLESDKLLNLIETLWGAYDDESKNV